MMLLGRLGSLALIGDAYGVILVCWHRVWYQNNGRGLGERGFLLLVQGNGVYV